LNHAGREPSSQLMGPDPNLKSAEVSSGLLLAIVFRQ
jgi:hypothetical protein